MAATDVDDVELFFTDSHSGSGSGPEDGKPAVVLVHGWTCDSHDWSFQIPALEADYRVIAVDLRGHGRSPAGNSGYSTKLLAGDVAQVLERRGVKTAVVIGHSLGGAVAAMLAVEYPDLIQGMVAIEPAYGMDDATVTFLRDVTGQFGTEQGRVLAADLMGATEPTTPAWLKTWHRRRSLGTPLDILQQSFFDMYSASDQICARPQTEAYLAKRESPTLAFHRFPAMAAWEQGIFRHPYSRAVSWEGAGHWLHQERTVEFNALVLAWLDGLPAELSEAVEGAK